MDVAVSSHPAPETVNPPASDDRLQDEIRQRLADRWRAYFPARAAGPAPEIVCRNGARSRGFSVMWEYELAFAEGRSEFVLAKSRRDSRFGPYMPHEVTVAPELLRREFDELSRAHRHFRRHADGLRVVRPFDYFEDLNTVVIERASGRDLGVLARTHPKTSLAAFRLCGQWLRAFHADVHAARRQHWMIEEFEGRLIRRREQLLGAGVPAAQLDPLCRQIVAVAQACRQREMPASMLHGDYKLRHIWASRGSIQVFDFGNVHEGHCYVDVAAFLVELSALRLGHPWFDRQTLAKYTETFLHGYFAAPGPQLLGLYIVEALLKKWVRRRRTWSRTAAASRVQTCVRRVGAKGLVERWYLDRWFIARINESLQMAAGIQR
jgi:hypothetical protein